MSGSVDKITLKIHKDLTLKNVFESGLRPFRYPSLESRILGLKNVSLSFVLPSGVATPEIDADWCQIRPYRSGKISSFVLETLWMGERDFNSILASFEHVPDFDYRDSLELLNKSEPLAGEIQKVILWRQTGNLDVSLYARRLLDSKGVEMFTVKMRIDFSKDIPLIQRKPFLIPIPPPKGFEGVSMAAPQEFGPSSSVKPTHSAGRVVKPDTSNSHLVTPSSEFEQERKEEKISFSEGFSKQPIFTICLLLLLFVGLMVKLKI